ncbi:MAG: aminotransferase class III-fold pyridoxal phosphate-dependent enzyme [Candidatus Rokubacteria bacterium]|nr:aminotransferase class III-fold pyridoxal phosphate-dependent enzyme [Candidatus Rokubacteria bacterium]
MTDQTDQRELLARAQKIFPGGILGTFRFPEGLEFVAGHGRGARVWDLAGRQYIDHVLGSGPLILGHAHPAVVEAVRRQMDRGSSFYTLTAPAIALAERILSASPCGEQLRFAASGAEATFYALRLARAFTGRRKILKFEGAYHGHHDDVLISSSTPSPGFPLGVEDSHGISPARREEVLVAPFNDQTVVRNLVEAHHRELAAIIVEPYQRVIAPHPRFLPLLRELATRYGVILVFDEVVTGFRVAWGGAAARYGVTPDLAAYGKIIGGGLPLSAVVGRAEIMELCDSRRKGQATYVYQSGTLNGHPVAAAAGLATLEVLAEPGAYERLSATGEAVRGHLGKAVATRGLAGQVLGIGPMWHVLFTEEPITDHRAALRADRARLLRFQAALLEQGVLVNPGVRSYLSLVHTAEDLEMTYSAIDHALDVVARAATPK